ncbi:hypothetical protein HaLaN_25231, partial [Haematococcus lacustris]
MDSALDLVENTSVLHTPRHEAPSGVKAVRFRRASLVTTLFTAQVGAPTCKNLPSAADIGKGKDDLNTHPPAEAAGPLDVEGCVAVPVHLSANVPRGSL